MGSIIPGYPAVKVQPVRAAVQRKHRLPLHLGLQRGKLRGGYIGWVYADKVEAIGYIREHVRQQEFARYAVEGGVFPGKGEAVRAYIPKGHLKAPKLCQRYPYAAGAAAEVKKRLAAYRQRLLAQRLGVLPRYQRAGPRVKGQPHKFPFAQYVLKGLAGFPAGNQLLQPWHKGGGKG